MAQELKPILSMHLSNRHTVLTRVLLLLFFLANSGFTVVLYQCSMSGTMETMPCCAMPEQPAAKKTGTSNPLTSAGIRAVNLPCTSVRVAGGLNLHPTTLENERGAKVLRAGMATGLSSEIFAFRIQPKHSVLFTTPDSYVRTSSVETYVLNATFLI